MTNTNIELRKSQLLAFLVKPSTGFTEHYVSSQPLSIYIPYTEYILLIKDLIELNLDILRTPLSVYRNAISKGEDSLPMYKLYHYDIALSGIEEISKSYKRGFQCTRIFGLVDYPSSLIVKPVSFESSAEFIQSNFSQVERTELHKLIRNHKDIPMSILSECGDMLANTYMYYMSMAYMGVFKMQKDFILSVKEN